ncbi:MAG: ABC transporter substrate-binding protein [Actinomycetota bacterium]
METSGRSRFARRSGAAVISTVVLLIGLASCGDSDEATTAATETATAATPAEQAEAAPTTETVAPTSGPDDSPTTNATAAQPAAFPVTVTHPLGTTTIEERPTRIVTLTDGGGLSSLLSLGLQPVAFGQRTDPLVSWIADRIDADVETFDGDVTALNFELIAGYEPDLIIGQVGFLEEANFELVSQIAPTVATPDGWRDILRIVAEATGTVEVGATVRAATEQLIEDFDPGIDGPLPSLTFAVFGPEQFFVFNERSTIGMLMAEVGIGPLAAPIDNEFAPNVNVFSAEEVEAIDTDALILLDPFGGSPEAFEANPLTQSLPAVQADRVLFTDPIETRSLNFDSVLTVPINLEFLRSFYAELQQ